jgi:hypothetical protein
MQSCMLACSRYSILHLSFKLNDERACGWMCSNASGSLWLRE